MKLEVTMFSLPNGQRSTIYGEIDDDLEEKVKEITDAGFIFEMEVLRTGQVSTTIGDPVTEMDCAFSITANDERVRAGLEKMIREFDVPTYVAKRNEEDASV